MGRSQGLRGLGYVVDLWGFVAYPDDACPVTHVLRDGRCMTVEEIGFNPDIAALSYLDIPIVLNPGPNPAPGTRVAGIRGASSSSPRPPTIGSATPEQIAAALRTRNDALLAATVAGATPSAAPAASSGLPVLQDIQRSVLGFPTGGAEPNPAGLPVSYQGAAAAPAASGGAGAGILTGSLFGGIPNWVLLAGVLGLAVASSRGGGR